MQWVTNSEVCAVSILLAELVARGSSTAPWPADAFEVVVDCGGIVQFLQWQARADSQEDRVRC